MADREDEQPLTINKPGQGEAEAKLFGWVNPAPTANLTWLGGQPVESTTPILYTIRITGTSQQ